MNISRLIIPFVSALLFFVISPAEAIEGVQFGAFIDTYFAYDFNNPADYNRAFTTQSAQHNDFNLNLVYLDAILRRDRMRGRLAFQAGTAVEVNYAGEVSGGTLSRHIQEANIGIQVNDKLWIDAGIYPSHIGLESFVSYDNWNYGRSMVAEYSPFYQTGVKLGWEISSAWSTQIHVLNGWQNVSETSPEKALGFQLKRNFGENSSVTYNHFSGWEPRYRSYHDLVGIWALNDRWSLGAALDFGHQRRVGPGWDLWGGFAILSQTKVSPSLNIGGRLEAFVDEHEIAVFTSSSQGLSGNGFMAYGGSINFDVLDWSPIVWRTELRVRLSDRALFPRGASGLTRCNTTIATSFALKL
jgi:hypothetical protein